MDDPNKDLDEATKIVDNLNETGDSANEPSEDTLNANEATDNTNERVNNLNNSSGAFNTASAATASASCACSTCIPDACVENAQNIARIFTRYLMRLYDISSTGESDIEEVEGMPRAFQVLLRDSIEMYNNSSYFKELLPISDHANRREELRDKLVKEFISKGDILTHMGFLTFCSSFVLAAYDLKKLAGFTEAPDCVVEALVHAFLLTDQSSFLHLWRTQLGIF